MVGAQARHFVSASAGHDDRGPVAGGVQYVHIGLVEAIDEGLGHHLPGRAHGLDGAIPRAISSSQ